MRTHYLIFSQKHGKRGVIAVAVLAICFWSFGFDHLEAQSSSDKEISDFEAQVRAYLIKNGLGKELMREPSHKIQTEASKPYPPGELIVPQIKIRPVVPLESQITLGTEAEGRRRALRALDDAIKDEILRERRLQ